MCFLAKGGYEKQNPTTSEGKDWQESARRSELQPAKWESKSGIQSYTYKLFPIIITAKNKVLLSMQK